MALGLENRTKFGRSLRRMAAADFSFVPGPLTPSLLLLFHSDGICDNVLGRRRVAGHKRQRPRLSRSTRVSGASKPVRRRGGGRKEIKKSCGSDPAAEKRSGVP